MEKNVRIGKLQGQKKFLLILPLLIIPFLTMACWAMGVGKGDDAGTTSQKTTGLNLELPSAKLKDDGRDNKMSFYERAQQNEQKTEDAMKNDTYYQFPNLNGSSTDSNELDNVVAKFPTGYDPVNGSGLNASPIHSEGYKDPNEEKIIERLNLLQREIDKPQKNASAYQEVYQREPTPLNQDVDRLEEMMNLMKDRQQNDPEMERLEGMLDRVIDIQHPDRVKERMKEKSLLQKEKVFAVTRSRDYGSVSLFGIRDTDDKKTRVVKSGFYGVDSKGSTDVATNAIEAVVHETQTLVNGSVVKFRLLNDIYIAGNYIPKDNFIYGLASLNGERLQIEIHSIRYEQSLFPVNLEVHDIDGLLGIYVPGAITRDVAKQSADNSLQGLELANLNPSLGAQAATAGISAAKSLLSKKVRLVKVTVKAGYKVLLRDKNNQ